ncbi:hypothetical protein H6P81_021717 [Aristolochia fimbriata]|uniref:Uncharacterized protein n=1 Tax=Aristolochia fimbriata TaxID=158543 RepID=A0AAV7DP65_ARIFI|nr:hypothetical protein H6P81_021717 [Aristolochia fimbriata]
MGARQLTLASTRWATCHLLWLYGDKPYPPCWGVRSPFLEPARGGPPAMVPVWNTFCGAGVAEGYFGISPVRSGFLVGSRRCKGMGPSQNPTVQARGGKPRQANPPGAPGPSGGAMGLTCRLLASWRGGQVAALNQTRGPGSGFWPGDRGLHEGQTIPPGSSAVGTVVDGVEAFRRSLDLGGGINLGPVGPCVLRERPRVAVTKAIAPQLPLGDGLQLFPVRGKNPSGQRPFCLNSRFFDLSALSGTVRCPSPDLDLPVRRLWRLCFAIPRAGHRRRGLWRVASGATLDILASGASGPYEPSWQPSSLLSPRTSSGLVGGWHSPEMRRVQSGVSVYFPPGLVSRGWCSKRPDARVFMDPCESRRSRWTWLSQKSESDRLNFCFRPSIPTARIGAYHGIGGWRRGLIRRRGLKRLPHPREGSGSANYPILTAGR